MQDRCRKFAPASAHKKAPHFVVKVWGSLADSTSGCAFCGLCDRLQQRHYGAAASDRRLEVVEIQRHRLAIFVILDDRFAAPLDRFSLLFQFALFHLL